MSETKYPVLWNFLGCWFPDADLENLTDEEVVTDFLNVRDKEMEMQVLKEMKSLLIEDNFPCDEISDQANRYFESEEECRSWLEEIHYFLKRGLS